MIIQKLFILYKIFNSNRKKSILTLHSPNDIITSTRNNIIWSIKGETTMHKKFLLRISEEQFRILNDLSENRSLNEYLNEIINLHIEKVNGRYSRMEKIIINDLQVSQVREAVTVTQQKWYMDLLLKYNIYFFSSSKMVTPMMNILFYGDSSCDFPNCISHIGKVSHIYRHIAKNEMASIPELVNVMKDPNFSSEIMKWNDCQFVYFSEVKELPRPIPLIKPYVHHPRTIVNNTTTMLKALTAEKIDDLF